MYFEKIKHEAFHAHPGYTGFFRETRREKCKTGAKVEVIFELDEKCWKECLVQKRSKIPRKRLNFSLRQWSFHLLSTP